MGKIQKHSSSRSHWLTRRVQTSEHSRGIAPPPASLQGLPPELRRNIIYASMELSELYHLSNVSPFFGQDVDVFVEGVTNTRMPIMPKGHFALAVPRGHLPWPKNIGVSRDYPVDHLNLDVESFFSHRETAEEMSPIAHRLRNHKREQFVYLKIIRAIELKNEKALKELLNLHPACNLSEESREDALWRALAEKAMFAVEFFLPTENYKKIDTVRLGVANQDLGVNEFLKQSTGTSGDEVDVGHLFWATKDGNTLLLKQLLEKMGRGRQAKAKEINKVVRFETDIVHPAWPYLFWSLFSSGPILDRCVSMAARDAKSYECLELLIAAGGDVNAPGYMGDRPLQTAVECSNLRAFTTLLAAGANPSLFNAREGDTPVHLAIRLADRGFMEALIASGHNRKTPNRGGVTAEDNAYMLSQGL